MHFEAVFISLFAVATAVALAARWLKIPYTVALVVAGLLLGTTRVINAPHLTKELLYAIFLPGLVFEAAFHLDFHKFWQNKLAIHALAVPGVAAAIGITAVLLQPAASALHFVDGFTMKHALVFAALIAATDPIAVVALFKTLGAPKRLAVLVEGESLLNDGTAVVFFTLILGAVTGDSLSIGGAVVDFVRVVGLGTLVGVLVGYLASKLTQRVDDPMIEITLTTIAAYGSFIIAEHFHLSGVIATVAAGMLCGNYGARTGMSPSTRIAVESFWEYVAFALNSIVFLLIGFEVHLSALLLSWKMILVAYMAVTLGRAALIYAVTWLLRRTRETLPWSWSAVLTWGGLRGGLSMVLVLALPRDFPHRDLLVTMTFGVVLISILLQGLSMGPLLRKLGLIGLRADRKDYERERGMIRAKTAAVSALEQLLKDGAVHPESVARVRDEYSGAITDAEQRITDMHLQAEELRTEEQLAARRHMLIVEKDAILAAFRKGYLSQEVCEELLVDVDARLLSLDPH
ncbi:MAG: Na+/H+ antiporter [Deltaproteobacteria bacterium]|nr:Na+/H+ antiporter [Deltaproteobacteria bacterium]